MSVVGVRFAQKSVVLVIVPVEGGDPSVFVSEVSVTCPHSSRSEALALRGAGGGEL